MKERFDPYDAWLGISSVQHPIDHYTLLGLERYESDREKIMDAADFRMETLRKYQTGKNSELSQKILNQVAAARVCLLDEKKRPQYDLFLRQLVDYRSLPPMQGPQPLLPPEPEGPRTSFLRQNEPVRHPDQWLMPIEQRKRAFEFRLSRWLILLPVFLLVMILMGLLLRQYFE